jgi:O-antigen/teichoic acid export membrane protein
MNSKNGAAISREAADAGQIKISGGLIARNTLLNLIGLAAPLLVAILTIPYVVHDLGTDRFGILSLAWVVLGYFSIFDLGLGRATTKYVAEALGKGERDQVPQILWTAASFQLILGFIGTIVLFGITDLLVERVLNIPPCLITEAKDTFHLIALSVPIVLVTSSFRGSIEAAQRFDLVNAVTIPSSILTFLLPVVGLYLGFGLPGIVALVVLARFAAFIAFVVINFLIIPQLRTFSGSFALFSRLFSFGGWVMISSIVSPFLVYLDRVLIGSILTIAAVSYYTAPYEMVTRIWIITGSLAMTLFPAFSALEGAKDRQRVGNLLARSIKYIFITTGPIVVFTVVYAEEILQVWLGDEFASESAVVMQILALGVLINSLAHTPYALLQGTGRPDLPAKFHMIELPIYIVMVWVLVNEFGIVGAAGAWTLRVIIDTFLLLGASFYSYQISPNILKDSGTKNAVIGFFILMWIAYILKVLSYPLSLVVQSLFSTLLLIVFVWAAWNYILDDIDRSIITLLTKSLLPPLS